MKYILLFFLLVSCSVTAQTDSVKHKQISFAYNFTGPMRLNTTSMVPIAFMKIRNRNHAFRLSYFANSYFSYANGKYGVPYVISLTDTELVFRSYYYGGSKQAINVSYEWYEETLNPIGFELIAGIGLHGGLIDNYNKYFDIVYNVDSLGNFQLSNSPNNSPNQIDKFTYNGFQIGVTPSFGINYRPDKIFNVSAQVYSPITLYLKNYSESELSNSSSYGFDLLYSFDLIMNLNLHSKYKNVK